VLNSHDGHSIIPRSRKGVCPSTLLARSSRSQPSERLLDSQCGSSIGAYTYQLMADNMHHDEMFATTALQDDAISSIIIATSPGYYKGQILANDDHYCLVMISDCNITLFNKTMSKYRDIPNTGSLPTFSLARQH